MYENMTDLKGPERKTIKMPSQRDTVIFSYLCFIDKSNEKIMYNCNAATVMFLKLTSAKNTTVKDAVFLLSLYVNFECMLYCRKSTFSSYILKLALVE